MHRKILITIPSTAAFSLVELSIVLVILGLLTGGILGGRELIRAAELRSVVTEFEQYQTAVYSFQSRYDALPGDMPNATRFWGRADGGGFSGQCASPATDTGEGKHTCNGNGDGRVPFSSNESFRFWQHLANAGLIAGNYTGIHGSGGNSHHVLGVNSPRSRISNVGWGFDEASKKNHAGYWDINGEDHNNTWVVGGESGQYSPENAAFTPQEAWSIDTKLDDGRPGTGRVISSKGRGTCNTGTTPEDYLIAEYKLTESAIRCTLHFPHVF